METNELPEEYQEVKNPYDIMTDGIRHMAWQEGFKAQEPNLIETADFFHKAKEGYEKDIKLKQEIIDGQRTTLSEQYAALQSKEEEINRISENFAALQVRLGEECTKSNALEEQLKAKDEEIERLREALIKVQSILSQSTDKP